MVSRNIKIGLLLITAAIGLSSLFMFGMEEGDKWGYQQPVQGQQQVQFQPGNGTVALSAVADWVCGQGGETGFRQKNGWLQGMLGWNNNYKFYTEDQIKDWIRKEYRDRNQSLLSLAAEGTLEFNTIGQLRQKDTFRINQKGTLDILIDDVSQPHKTDIRTLLADSQNNRAVFQIASTPSVLEGGMHKEYKLVGTMYKGAVQGEFASLATMPATLWRKYCLPTCNKEYFENREFYLWHLCKKINIKKGSTGRYISYFDLEKAQIDQFDVNSIGVGIHSDVPVVIGYGPPVMVNGKPDPRAPNAQQPIITDPNQKVTLVLASAFDFRTVDKVKKKNSAFKQNNNGGINKFAKIILDAAYEGTIRAAIATGKKRVFLTIMGGGSFRNDITWVYESIAKIKDLIKASGLHVTLVYRPDAGRQGGLRTAQTDITFLQNMAQLMADINGGQLNKPDKTLDTAIAGYCTQAYNKQSYSQQAQDLQNLFNQLASGALPQQQAAQATPVVRQPQQQPQAQPQVPPMQPRAQATPQGTSAWLPPVTRQVLQALAQQGQVTTPPITSSLLNNGNQPVATPTTTSQSNTGSNAQPAQNVPARAPQVQQPQQRQQRPQSSWGGWLWKPIQWFFSWIGSLFN